MKSQIVLIVIRIVICFIECKEKSLDIFLKRLILSKLNIKLKIMIQQGAIPSVFAPVLGQTFIFGARGKVSSDQQIIRQNKQISDGSLYWGISFELNLLRRLNFKKEWSFFLKAFVNRKQCEIQGEVNLSFFWSVFLLY